MNIFERAVRNKVRFATQRNGEITTEDLFDLSLTSLNDIGKGIIKQLKAEQEESLIETKSKASVELELKLELVKHVIAAKQAQAEIDKNRAQKQSQLSFLKKLKEEKEIENLKGKSLEELDAQIAELENA